MYGKTLVLGLGNPIVGDDAVGLHVAREVRRLLGDRPDIEVQECCCAGVALLDTVTGYDTLVVVDAVRSGHPRGSVLRLDPQDLPKQPTVTDMHGIGLIGALELGRRVGLDMPSKVRIVAIAVDGDYEASESLSDEVGKAVPEAAEQVLEELRCTLSP